MLRIAAVSYLNTKPLIEGLASQAGVSLSVDLPSRLAELLQTDQADAALVPIIDYLRHPEWELACELGIASDGPVLSVMVFSKVPMDRVRTLAADEGSHTSITLTKLLFGKRFGRIPQIRPLAMAEHADRGDCDAVLLIGNRALQAELSEYPHCWDLGLEWKRETQLPMVYAVWACRKNAPRERLRQTLLEAGAKGMANIARIAHQASQELGIDGALCRRYLEQIIHFSLGKREFQAIDRFSEWCLRQGILPEGCGKNHALLCA